MAFVPIFSSKEESIFLEEEPHLGYSALLKIVFQYFSELIVAVDSLQSDFPNYISQDYLSRL